MHVPLNEHTKHLINRNSFKKFKRGALLINTARGALVETDALIEALQNGILSGAGLDVIEGEELLIEENLFNSPIDKAAKLIVESKKLIDNENVVLAPYTQRLQKASSLCAAFQAAPQNAVFADSLAASYLQATKAEKLRK